MIGESVAGRRYDAALHLLDRQIVDPDGRLVAKVDELELAERPDGRIVVTALLTGPGALGPRVGGRAGHWTVAIWRRLRPEPDPKPGRIDFADVVSIDSAVHVGRRRHALGVDGLERWMDDNVVSRIPGAGHDPQ
jgi:hypothetical protein